MSRVSVPPKFQNEQPVKKSGPSALVIVLIVVAAFLLLVFVGAVLLIWPAFSSVRTAAKRTLAKNHCRQTAIALVSYNDMTKRLPPAVTSSDDGTPLHSWRTEILPYLEQASLHDRIDFNKPWDDPANAITKDIQIEQFQSPRVRDSAPNTAHFVAVVGKGTLFDPEVRRGVSLNSVKDGTANTIMLIEYQESNIPWNKPEDVSIEKAISIIKNADDQGTIVAFANCTVAVIPNSFDEAELRALFTRNGGESIKSDW